MGVAAIDLGEINIITLTFDKNTRPIIYRCPTLKQLNKNYTKQVGNIYEDMDYMRVTNRKIEGIRDKQIRRTNHLFYQLVKELCKDLEYHQIKTLVIGKSYNKNKGKSNKKDGQSHFNDLYVNFKITFNQLIGIIKKKAAKKGIEVILVDEAYTSRASCLDLDDICQEGVETRIFSGKRVDRDTYKTNTGIELSSDVNASYNILRRSGLSLTVNETLLHYQNIKQVPKPYVKTITERR